MPAPRPVCDRETAAERGGDGRASGPGAGVDPAPGLGAGVDPAPGLGVGVDPAPGLGVHPSAGVASGFTETPGTAAIAVAAPAAVLWSLVAVAALAAVPGANGWLRGRSLALAGLLAAGAVWLSVVVVAHFGAVLAGRLAGTVR